MNTAVLLVIVGHPTGAAMHGVKAGPIDANQLYPYRSSSFNGFIDASYGAPGNAGQFYAWMHRAIRKAHFRFPDQKRVSLEKYLRFKRSELTATHEPVARTAKERALAASLHAMVKRILPHFSLEQGFEFRNAVDHGQRQCFLQSVLIASLLQRAGVSSGVAMVNRNIEGQETNNKHAVCLVRLSDGLDLIVDASEDTPFARQQGLFLSSTSGYQFVRPAYDSFASITGYHSYKGDRPLGTGEIRPLNGAFILSQFDYYRGERSPGGVMAKTKTESGLSASTKFLEKSVREDPQNCLAQYMLGRVYLYRGLKPQAARSLDKAMTLYQREGWIPPDERMADNRAHKYS